MKLIMHLTSIKKSMYLRYIKIHNMNLKSYLKILKLQNGDSNLLQRLSSSIIKQIISFRNSIGAIFKRLFD